GGGWWGGRGGFFAAPPKGGPPPRGAGLPCMRHPGQERDVPPDTSGRSEPLAAYARLTPASRRAGRRQRTEVKRLIGRLIRVELGVPADFHVCPCRCVRRGL